MRVCVCVRICNAGVVTYNFPRRTEPRTYNTEAQNKIYIQKKPTKRCMHAHICMYLSFYVPMYTYLCVCIHACVNVDRQVGRQAGHACV